MGISSEHFNTIAYLSDLRIQCCLFKRSYEKLKIAAIHRNNLYQGVNDGNKFMPLDIIAECTVCLSVMSAVRRLLFSVKTANSQKRSQMLRELLDYPLLTHISSKNVRNSWEHHDERLDKLLDNFSSESKLGDIYVDAKPLGENSIFLKRFDPINMSIHFLNDVTYLAPCIEEVDMLIERLNMALDKLR